MSQEREYITVQEGSVKRRVEKGVYVAAKTTQLNLWGWKGINQAKVRVQLENVLRREDSPNNKLAQAIKVDIVFEEQSDEQ